MLGTDDVQHSQDNHSHILQQKNSSGNDSGSGSSDGSSNGGISVVNKSASAHHSHISLNSWALTTYNTIDQ